MNRESKDLARRIVGLASTGEDSAERARRVVAPNSTEPVGAVARPDAKDGAAGEPGEQGPQGPAGPRGPEGDVGPMPHHEWKGTKLRFEQAPGGEWGEAVELKGEKGEPGPAGASGVIVQKPAPTFSFFPNGW